MTTRHQPRAFGGKGAAKDGLLPETFYDLAADVGETTDVIGKHSEVAARLRDDIGDSATNQKGKNRRPMGCVPASGQLCRAHDKLTKNEPMKHTITKATTIQPKIVTISEVMKHTVIFISTLLMAPLSAPYAGTLGFCCVVDAGII